MRGVVVLAMLSLSEVDFLFALLGDPGAGSDPDMDLIDVAHLLPKLGIVNFRTRSVPTF